MARTRTPDVQDEPADDGAVDTSALGDGTYYVPDVGIVMNGDLFDGNDLAAVEAFHAATAPDAVVPVLAPEEPVLAPDEVVAPPAPVDPDSGLPADVTE